MRIFSQLKALSVLEKIALGISFLFVFLVNRIMITSNDTWWQIKTGEWMVNNGEIYSGEVFSFPVLGKTYIAYQWLSQVMFYLISDPQGKHLSYLIWAIFLAIAIVSLKTFIPKLKFDNSSAFVFAVFSLLLAFRNEARPHIFGLLFTTVLISIFFKWLDTKDKKLFWFFVPLQILWVNTHGSFLLGPAFLFCFAGFFALEKIAQKFLPSSFFFKEKETDKNIVHLILAGFILLAASLVNPLGLNLLIKSFSMFFTHSYLQTSVHEWYPFFKMRWGYWAYFWMLWQTTGWCYLFISRKKVRLFYWLLMALSLYFPLSAVRYISLSVILSLPILIKFRPDIRILKELSLTTIIVLLGASSWVGVNGYPQAPGYYYGPGVGYDLKKIPLSIFQHMKAHGYTGRLLTHYNTGASVIYHLWPNILTNIDSRTELYEADQLKIQELALKTEDGMKDYLKKFDIKFVLLPSFAMPIRDFLEKHPDWIFEKLDYEHFLFVRKDVSVWAQKGHLQSVADLKVDPYCVFVRTQGFCEFTSECTAECKLTDQQLVQYFSLKDPNCLKFTGVCSSEFACGNCLNYCIKYNEVFESLRSEFNPKLSEMNACFELMKIKM